MFRGLGFGWIQLGESVDGSFLDMRRLEDEFMAGGLFREFFWMNCEAESSHVIHIPNPPSTYYIGPWGLQYPI